METTNVENGKAAGGDELGNDTPSSSDCRYGVIPMADRPSVAAQRGQCDLCCAPAPGDMQRVSNNSPM